MFLFLFLCFFPPRNLFPFPPGSAGDIRRLMTMFHTRGWGEEDSRLVKGADFKPAQLPARGELLTGRPRGCPGWLRPRGWLRPGSGALGRRRISGARRGCVPLSSPQKKLREREAEGLSVSAVRPLGCPSTNCKLGDPAGGVPVG